MTYRSIVVLAGATLAAALNSAATAQAAAYTCESSALRGQLLTAPALEPITANKGQPACKAARGGLASALPAPVATSALFAETALTPASADAPAQTATASAGVADLRLGPALDLGVQLPVDQALAGVAPVVVPGVGTLDLRAAILGALGPSPEVLRVQLAAAYAKASCVGATVRLEGSSQLAGIRLAGLEIPTDAATTQAVNVIGGGTISPSQLDLQALLPPGVTLTPLVEALVRPALAALPPITIPATIAELKITPGRQTTENGTLTQRALELQLSLAGQQIADLTLGEARIGAGDVTCVAAGGAASQAALQCTTRRLVLTDVVERGGRVRLEGAADRRFIGRTVDIHFVGPSGGGPRVAQARVRSNGTFTTTARLPARKVRATNRARYQARLGQERSLRLKLQRRMVVRSVRVSASKVRIAGRVSRPLATPARAIEVRRRVSCRRWAVVKRIRPKRDGTWATTVDAPPSAQAATYRFATKVRKTRRNPKTYPTFTLPRFVDLT